MGMINTDNVVAMIEHWLGTPPNGYFGSSYGNPLGEYLLVATDAFAVDAFFEKLKTDIPLLQKLGDRLELVHDMPDFDKARLYIKLGEVAIEVTTPNTSTRTDQDYFYVTAS